MTPHRQRAWNQDVKMMTYPEELLTKDCVWMYLNQADDYIWMRSTDLFDKNGKEIFEGDIFDDGFKYRDSVIFKNGAFREKKDGEPLSGCRVTDLEVIGNCYENPELMERKE